MLIFIFRRDYRIEDNLGLIECISEAEESGETILPIFVYNESQIDSKRNEYFSNNAMQFLIESLRDLEGQIKDVGGNLYKFIVQKTEDEVELLLSLIEVMKDSSVSSKVSGNGAKSAVSKVYSNMDLTPFARYRDDILEAGLDKEGIPFLRVEDYTLFSMDEPKTKTSSGTAYQIHSFLYKKIKVLHDIIPRVQKFSRKSSTSTWAELSSQILNTSKIKKFTLSTKRESSFYTENKELSVNGGRSRGLKILKRLKDGEFKDYKKTRDVIADDTGTTRLSAYLKFGCVSIREVYWSAFEAYGLHNPINRELFFREFYYGIVWFYPRVLKGMIERNGKGGSKAKGDTQNEPFTDIGLRWRTGKDKESKKDFEAWKSGHTGVPLVDAGMRQLNTIGFMHNRARMITSMFLIKDLYIDWRQGEQYFATKLVDYDPSQNNAGWMWSSSLAPYSTAYYRTMNPYTQQKRFDKDGEYVKRWIPELEKVAPNDLVRWEDEKVRKKYDNVPYPKPIVEDHTKRVKEIEEKYRSAM